MTNQPRSCLESALQKCIRQRNLWAESPDKKIQIENQIIIDAEDVEIESILQEGK